MTDQIVKAVEVGIMEMYGQSAPQGSVVLQETREGFEGELTLVVFPFLRISRKKPEDTAQDLGQYLVANLPGVVRGFNVVKGFLNLSIQPACWISLLQDIWQNPRYGFTPVTESSPLVMIEYSSPNTNKPLHLGHVRNNLLGLSLIHI